MAGPETGTLFWLGGPNGTPFGYANWDPGLEPNNAGGNEDAAIQRPVFALTGAHWNDVAVDGFANYVIEYSPAPVPEPASMTLLGTGLVGLLAVRRRRRKSAPLRNGD